MSEVWEKAVLVVASVAATGLLGVFSGWWRDKTTLPIKVIKAQGKLGQNQSTMWEKMIMLRKVLENAGHKVPDREWSYDDVVEEERS